MGSKGPMRRPDRARCSQYKPWCLGQGKAEGMRVPIRGDGPFDFEQLTRDLGIRILRSDDTDVAKALQDGIFRETYPIDEFPLVFDTMSRSMVSRHGQIYARKTPDPNLWSLRSLGLSRTLYPRFSFTTIKGGKKGKRNCWTCHRLMAKLTLGKRPDRKVIDHVGQDNKEDFRELNLEYVSYEENSRRHVEFMKRQREEEAAAEEKAAVRRCSHLPGPPPPTPSEAEQTVLFDSYPDLGNDDPNRPPPPGPSH